MYFISEPVTATSPAPLPVMSLPREAREISINGDAELHNSSVSSGEVEPNMSSVSNVSNQTVIQAHESSQEAAEVTRIMATSETF